MMATHLLVPLSMTPEAAGPESAAARIAGVLAEGTSSTLFAVVGGCSLVLAARTRLLAGDRRRAVRAGGPRGARAAGGGPRRARGPARGGRGRGPCGPGVGA